MGLKAEDREAKLVTEMMEKITRPTCFGSTKKFFACDYKRCGHEAACSEIIDKKEHLRSYLRTQRECQEKLKYCMRRIKKLRAEGITLEEDVF